MYGLIIGIVLSTFVSIDGNLVEMNTDSAEYAAYEASVVTDIGNPENLNITDNLESAQTSTVSGSDAGSAPTETVQVIEQDNTAVVALLEESVELLAENSATVTGTVNSSVLELMDRMIDSYPSFYKYAGFRTSSDDAYSTTLYIAKKATAEDNTITFSDDCICVDFSRTSSGYSSYVSYDVSDSPNASVDIGSNAIVYTNALDGYPTLGNKSQFPDDYIWIGLLALVAIVLFTRRNH